MVVRMTRALGLVLAWLLLAACGRDEPTLPPNNSETAVPRHATEWPAYGGDDGGLRYAAQGEIGPDNVARLELAWSYRHGDVSPVGSPEGISSFQATPILVDGMLYFPTPWNRVIALDPATGAEHWRFDPGLDRTQNHLLLISRGVAAWKDARRAAGTPCARRILTATRDAFLIALDAKTGEPCADFGVEGRVDLNPAVGPLLFRGEYGVTSAPTVIGDRVVVGAFVADNVRTDAPSGVVRAFDTRTGALAWAWDLAPPGYDYETRPKSSAGYALATPNVWAPMSADPERGLVFVPTGNPAPDEYRGGPLLDMDYYGSSVVALRAATGEVVWRFQTVHHDLWDYDVPAQPTLVDLVRDGKTVPALVQGTKMGLLFVLNRETGEPIFGVEERPVPQGGAPGEVISPTQPFPLKPPPLLPLTMPPEDAFGFTFFDRWRCRKALESMRNEGIYTPIGLDWTLLYPFPLGGVNWGGVAVDPARQLVVANTNLVVGRERLVPRAEYDELRKKYPEPLDGRAGQPQLGTPYAVQREVVSGPFGAPCNPPPWGSLAAVDLASGEIRWQRPLGNARDVGLPFDRDVGLLGFGGPLVTKSGLVFIGASMGNAFRAFDVATGDELWRTTLPAGAQATPMSYVVEDAPGGPRQFVVVAAGGHWGFNSEAGLPLGDALVAFALPRE
jgi:quinoprotein glucose dehydrogenase